MLGCFRVLRDRIVIILNLFNQRLVKPIEITVKLTDILLMVKELIKPIFYPFMSVGIMKKWVGVGCNV